MLLHRGRDRLRDFVTFAAEVAEVELVQRDGTEGSELLPHPVQRPRPHRDGGDRYSGADHLQAQVYHYIAD